MDEKPKSIWKKSFSGRTALVIWLAIAVFTIMLGSFIAALANQSQPMSETFLAWGIFAGGFLAVCLIFIYVVWPLLRWLFWKHWRRTLFGLACLATLIALAYVEEDWRGKHDWEKFKREWEAKGEHFDYASVIPKPVPDDQNFAMAPIWVESIEAGYGSNVTWQWYGKKLTAQEQAKTVDHLKMPLTENDSSWPTAGHGNWQKATLIDLKPWQNYYRTLATKTNLFPVAPQPQSPAHDVLLALSKYDSAIEELRQAGQRPYSRFPVYSDADHPFDTLLPHLAVFKGCVQILHLRAVAELQNDESEKALADVKLSLRLTEALRTEPFLISQLVRFAMLQIILQPVYEGLAEHRWSEAQLAQLDSELAKLDFLADFESSIRGERAGAVSAIDYMRRSREIELGDVNLKKANVNWIVPGAFFYQNELTIARVYQQYNLPLVNVQNQTVSPAQVRKLQAEAKDYMDHHWLPYKIFAKMLMPAYATAVKKFTYAQSSVHLARVAIALERYRLAHGEFPESLDALAPQFIAQVPHDVIGGQPLKYRREANGQFILYSVGWNETDDGGVVVFKKGSSPDVNPDQGDWVWRYPKKELKIMNEE